MQFKMDKFGGETRTSDVLKSATPPIAFRCARIAECALEQTAKMRGVGEDIVPPRGHRFSLSWRGEACARRRPLSSCSWLWEWVAASRDLWCLGQLGVALPSSQEQITQPAMDWQSDCLRGHGPSVEYRASRAFDTGWLRSTLSGYVSQAFKDPALPSFEPQPAGLFRASVSRSHTLFSYHYLLHSSSLRHVPPRESRERHRRHRPHRALARQCEHTLSGDA